MDNNERSIEELCEAFDKIISSDNEAVQRMFRHLLTLVELTDHTHNENKNLIGLGLRKKGPFAGMFDRIDNLERQVADLRKREPYYSMSKDMSSIGGMAVGAAGIDTITLSGLTAMTATMSPAPIPSLTIGDISLENISVSMSDSDHVADYINKIDKK